MVASERLAPLLQKPDETAIGYGLSDEILQDVEDAKTLKRGSQQGDRLPIDG